MEKIIRIPDRKKLIKLQLHSVEDNDKIKNNGLLLNFNKVTTNNIMQEMTTHRTNVAKQMKPVHCVVRHKDCKAGNLECVNCGGAHCALALSCPKI